MARLQASKVNSGWMTWVVGSAMGIWSGKNREWHSHTLWPWQSVRDVLTGETISGTVMRRWNGTSFDHRLMTAEEIAEDAGDSAI